MATCQIVKRSYNNTGGDFDLNWMLCVQLESIMGTSGVLKQKDFSLPLLDGQCAVNVFILILRSLPWEQGTCNIKRKTKYKIFVIVIDGSAARAQTKRTQVLIQWCCVKLLATLYYSSSLSYLNEYLAIDSGGYLCTNSLCALTALGWMLPREVEIPGVVFDWTGLPGYKVWSAMNSREVCILHYIRTDLLLTGVRRRWGR